MNLAQHDHGMACSSVARRICLERMATYEQVTSCVLIFKRGVLGPRLPPLL